jgi:hypothetical protein
VMRMLEILPSNRFRPPVRGVTGNDSRQLNHAPGTSAYN